MSDLAEELVEEILSWIPLTSLTEARCTCKPWNAYLRNRKQFTGYMVLDSKLCSMEFNLDLERFRVKQVNFLVKPSIKQASILNQGEICEVFHCDGLLLCVIKDDRWRFVWNPYLRQIMWIKPINDSHKFHTSDMYALGYDKNGTHKILRLLDVFKFSHLLPFYEIYDIYSDSWKILHLNSGCSIKSERFGTRLDLPIGTRSPKTKTVALSSVRDEQLVVLHLTKDNRMDIFIIRNITVNNGMTTSWTWSIFLRVELKPSFTFLEAVSFFIDEEKKIALVSESYKSSRACIIEVDGYFKSVNIREARKPGLECFCNQLVFSSYAPSVVELQPYRRRSKRKARDY
ncbi:unnamed protein product [Microthlaspi erraticum]|uniref:F-box domain-containing protein n=1 Tax=Microthlaspi erraticum TaxID=1685480 RepID=A0A6D2HFA9_9BRAS|nr:unnamed protein product [Microthlaspi erraticum]